MHSGNGNNDFFDRNRPEVVFQRLKISEFRFLLGTPTLLEQYKVRTERKFFFLPTLVLGYAFKKAAYLLL